jgi:hypothetical protein
MTGETVIKCRNGDSKDGDLRELNRPSQVRKKRIYERWHEGRNGEESGGGEEGREGRGKGGGGGDKVYGQGKIPMVEATIGPEDFLSSEATQHPTVVCNPI